MTAIIGETSYSFEEYFAYGGNPDSRYELVDGRLEIKSKDKIIIYDK